MKMLHRQDSMFSVSSQSSRRSARESAPSAGEGFSSQSVLNTVQDFVANVNAMNQTVMLPSRLMDMQIKGCDNQPLPDILRQEKDPYIVYGMLNNAKNELMNGISYDEDDEGFVPHKARIRRDTCIDRWADTNPIPTTTRSGYSTPVRRESDLSMLSVASSCSEDSDYLVEESNSSDGTDSALGVDDSALLRRSPAITSVEEASTRARDHLAGLQYCLSQLSDSAQFISDLYSEDMSK